MKNLEKVVATYNSHDDAEKAIRALNAVGFDMQQLSIIGKDLRPEEHVVGYYNVGNRMLAWGKFGAFWGAIGGLLYGSGMFFFPGIGVVLIGGPLTEIVLASLEAATAVGAVSALGAALYSIGIPKSRVIKHELSLKANKFLLVVTGCPEEIAIARSVLSKSAVEETEHHKPALEQAHR